MPSPARPSNNSQKSVATAARILEPIAKALRPTSTVLRFSRPIRTLLNMAVTAPTEAVAVTTCPAVPSLIPRSRAIGVNRPAGRNSADTSAKLAAAIERTANQVAGLHATGGAASRSIAVPSSCNVVSVIEVSPRFGDLHKRVRSDDMYPKIRNACPFVRKCCGAQRRARRW